MLRKNRALMLVLGFRDGWDGGVVRGGWSAYTAHVKEQNFAFVDCHTCQCSCMPELERGARNRFFRESMM